jgi:hypothetical protein
LHGFDERFRSRRVKQNRATRHKPYNKPSNKY